MHLTETLVFPSASIGRIEHKRIKGKTYGKVEIRAKLTPELASRLEVHDTLYLENGVTRGNNPDRQIWKNACASFRATHEPLDLKQCIEIHGDSITDVAIEPDPKHGGLKISLRLNYSGEASTVLEFMNYWLLVGEAPGPCRIVPVEEDQGTIAPSQSQYLLVNPATGEKTEISLPNQEQRRSKTVEMRRRGSDDPKVM